MCFKGSGTTLLFVSFKYVRSCEFDLIKSVDTHLCKLRDTPVARFQLFEDTRVPWTLSKGDSVHNIILRADTAHFFGQIQPKGI